MSRNRSSREREAFSPMQRKACVVLICCAIALILSIVFAVFMCGMGFSTGYDPAAYPVDTTLGSVLGQSDAAEDYVGATVFVGDQYTVRLCDFGMISLDQYVGKDGMKVGDVIKESCVNFADDSNSYTIPQAVAMMKARRVIVTLGSNDAAAGTDVSSVIQDYRQALKAISTAYSYVDVIVNAVPSVPKASGNMGKQQGLIDQYNQALAAMCNEDGYKFLNSSEAIKEESGYAQASYYDNTSEWNKNGASAFLQYVRSHAFNSDDRRPDTNDIPRRATQAAGGGNNAPTATPTATPKPFTLNYTVENGKGSLTGNGQNGVSSLTIEAQERESVSVTAVAASGYNFYKWSDGQTSPTRYDIVTQDLSVTAMFNDSRVTLTLDKADMTVNVGDVVAINSSVKLGEKAYDNSGVQWSVNNDMMATAGSYTFSAQQAGSYTVKAGLEINGTYASASFVINVIGPTPTPTPTPAPTPAPVTLTNTNPAGTQMTVGQPITLSISVANGAAEDVHWKCVQATEWQGVGTSVQFTAPAAGDYTFIVSSAPAEINFTVPAVNPA